MLRLKHLIPACVLALTVGTANAITLDVSGTYYEPNTPTGPAGPAFTGTLTVDTTALNIISANIFVDSLLPFPAGPDVFSIIVPSLFPPVWQPGLWNSFVDLRIQNQTQTQQLELYFMVWDLWMPTQFTVGNNLYAIITQAIVSAGCLGSTVVSGCDYAYGYSGSGLVTGPDVASTPLPAALPLFATGLGTLGLLGWRRKRKTAALAA